MPEIPSSDELIEFPTIAELVELDPRGRQLALARVHEYVLREEEFANSLRRFHEDSKVAIHENHVARGRYALRHVDILEGIGRMSAMRAAIESAGVPLEDTVLQAEYGSAYAALAAHADDARRRWDGRTLYASTQRDVLNHEGRVIDPDARAIMEAYAAKAEAEMRRFEEDHLFLQRALDGFLPPRPAERALPPPDEGIRETLDPYQDPEGLDPELLLSVLPTLDQLHETQEDALSDAAFTQLQGATEASDEERLQHQCAIDQCMANMRAIEAVTKRIRARLLRED